MNLNNTVICFPFISLFIVWEYCSCSWVYDDSITCLQGFIIRSYKPGRYILSVLQALGLANVYFRIKQGGFASYPGPLDDREVLTTVVRGVRKRIHISLGTGCGLRASPQSKDSPIGKNSYYFGWKNRLHLRVWCGAHPSHRVKNYSTITHVVQ